MRTRSWRRAQRERAIARARRKLRSQGWFTEPYTRWTDAEGEVYIRKAAVTPHPCSSYCCGNPRRWFKQVTRQEQAALIDQREQLD